MKHALQFPENFLWGASTASYQVEGGIENCDWAHAAKEGRVPVCGAACDHYNRFESDFDIARKLGHTCHKISLEWARIEPEEGKFDLDAVSHYRNVIRSLKSHGLEPFVNLWHFTLPLWFANDGGFTNKKSVERFKRYAEFVTKEILLDVTHILTVNEPEVWASNGYLRGNWPPFKKNIYLYNKAFLNVARAHNAAYDTIKSLHPKSLVSFAKNNMFFEAQGSNPFNHMRAWVQAFFWNKRFLLKTNSKIDFVGLNYYFYAPIGKRPPLPKTDMGWDIYPEGLYRTLIELEHYHKPVFIIENGIADASDVQRKSFIVNHIAQIHRAITYGIDVRGYMHWSLLDNYEWALGFKKRFGLVEVDFVTQQRTIRNSAFEYKSICETNRVELHI